MEASTPVLPLVTPFNGLGRDNCTIKDVLHQQTAAELAALGDLKAEGRHSEAAVRDTVRDIGQRLDNEVVVSRFEVAKAEAALARDIAATKCEVLASVALNAKETQREVFESRVRAEILAKENQLAAEKCCCETQKLILAEADRTRELIRSIKDQDLRADLAVLRTRVPPPVI